MLPFRLSIYVLESSTSRRLTYFMPPLVSLVLMLNTTHRLCTMWLTLLTFQNLIPLLCLRPLRLFFPAETLRRARIVLLKITHLPFVAIIWAYESSRRYMAQRVHSPPATTMSFSPDRPLSTGRTSLSRNVSLHPSRLPALNNTSLVAPSSPSTQRQSKGHGKSPAPASGTADPIADLMSLVEKLNAQVEELTSMVAGQDKD